MSISWLALQGWFEKFSIWHRNDASINKRLWYSSLDGALWSFQRGTITEVSLASLSDKLQSDIQTKLPHLTKEEVCYFTTNNCPGRVGVKLHDSHSNCFHMLHISQIWFPVVTFFCSNLKKNSSVHEDLIQSWDKQ